MPRITVIGEGADEHGDLGTGRDLEVAPAEGRGSLGALVTRLLRDRFQVQHEMTRWTAVDRGGVGRLRSPPLSAETLVDETLLIRLLDKLIRPVQLDVPGAAPLDLVVLSLDYDHNTAFGRTLARLGRKQPDLAERVIALVFKPELEILFVQQKEPLERAADLQVCSSKLPAKTGDLKKNLNDWRSQYAPHITVNARFRERVAGYLPIDNGSPLESIPAYRELVEGLAKRTQ